MRAALHDEDLSPQEFDYVNAHGTATRVGDLVRNTRAQTRIRSARASRADQLDEVRARTPARRVREPSNLRPASLPCAPRFCPQRSISTKTIPSVTSTTYPCPATRNRPAALHVELVRFRWQQRRADRWSCLNARLHLGPGWKYYYFDSSGSNHVSCHVRCEREDR